MNEVMATLHPPEVIDELRKNAEAYRAVMTEMVAEHWGKIVLLHNGEVDAVYDNMEDAYSIGREKYGEGHFSLHQVGQQPIDFGFQAYSLL